METMIQDSAEDSTLAQEEPYNSELYEFNKWDDLDLNPDILRGIYSYGFENPSEIQRKAIKPVIMGRDVIAQAQSGTGKTASFTIGALSHVNVKQNYAQVLILSPTRELTLQIANVVSNLGNLIPGFNVQCMYGGSSIDESVALMKQKPPHVICGCAGRVFDMIRRGNISARKIKLLILDEADEMLSEGFKDQVYNIFQYLNNQVQVALFSATFDPNIISLSNRFMRNPVRIFVEPEKLTLDGIAQYYVALIDDHEKYQVLKEIYSSVNVSSTIIYCNSVRRVIDLYEAMKDDGFPVCCIHSNMDRKERDDHFADFRKGVCRVLISSDVTARGIDVQQVSTVINFDIPKSVHTYLHRIGRSGRWGRKGLGINFVTRRDFYKLKETRQHYACKIDELPADLNSLFV
jgi:translation initiation factor 4A